ncbi:transient receptor potential cation channel,subfamily m, member, putative [Schistosoma mansoni]|uniref:transient receptor potential cation channel,subfamily m, member, putative n=1 Tax=Schistosoma mansoni TaxID=6183 RepID=UPI00022C8448|nr:transient receptor potential cation channel,subfamily m, member, putative [Schistosoma mansoni]|eukprot:XP_018644719.1 transient receptor potential cation channel,subfamily m, member, putative [Schistosoma mansoni]
MLEKSKEWSQKFMRGEEHVRDTKEKKISFVLKHFTFKECIKFVADPQYATETKPSDRCFCGEYRIYHYFHGQNRSETDNKEWSESECLKVVGPSNAFGQIEFITESTSNHKPTEFVRISDEDKLEDVMLLMKNYWKMMEPEKPSLCISVIGGAKNFVLEGHKKEVFYSGLVQAAQTTRAWIVTSGLNLGIIRVVGDALQEQSYSTDKRMLSQQLRCIGIAPWGYVLNRNTLVATNYEDHFHPIPYTVSTVIETGQPVSLNQNHTHYIFVDEGKRLRYGGCESARFRARLEKQIALPEEAGGFGIPVVLVIVEGGHDVFIDARNSIKERVPVVICSGTGRAADILDMAFNFRLKHNEFTSFTERECSILSQKLKIVSGKNKVEAALKMIQLIVKDTKLITTFDMNKSDDLDLAILFALIKTSSELDKQLRLALTWDRCDIAEAKIFRQGKQVKPDILEPIMMEALLRNKTDFVRILLQNGVVMRQFLTFERLHRLYNESTHSNDLIRCLKNYKLLTSEHLTVSSTKLHLPVMISNEMTAERGQSFTSPYRIYLSTICKLIRRMLGRYTNKIYDMDTEMVYVIFLLFFSYTLLFSTLQNEITIHEGFIMAYFIAMIIDIIRQIFLSPGVGPKKVATWWDQYEWGRSELFVILLALLSMFLRIGLETTFIYSKTFYVLTLITCYIRIYGLYSYHPNLGPKLVMIRSMLEELISFIFILIVVFLAYGISLHVLLYPNRHEFSWSDVRDVLYYPYWNLYGELSLDYTFAKNDTCGTNADGINCPIYHFLCPLFLAMYLMIAGTLLINLLIAIFRYCLFTIYLIKV